MYKIVHLCGIFVVCKYLQKKSGKIEPNFFAIKIYILVEEWQ